MKKITLITFLILLICNGKEVWSQATAVNNPTDANLLIELGGPGITLSNPSLENGNRNFQIATFSNGNTGANLDIDTGVLLTTGSTAQAFGSNGNAAFPSNSGVQASQTAQPDPITYSDADIIAIDPTAVFDVVVYSFDVVLDANLTAIQITYQFGSDEYPDYVGTIFNDVFGFFVSGPGITGSQNIAQVPGTDNPVSVNSVNGGFFGCNNANAGIAAPADLTQSSLFINNGYDAAVPPGPPGTCNTNPGPFPIFTEYNGVTNQFTGTINGLVPGVTYRFKLALADTGDRTLDSGVFINQIIGTNDIDGDGTSDQADLDDDNDGILDTDENTLNVDPSGDTDGDLILNYEDFDDNGTATAPVCLDADINGICDTLDPVFDFDGDNVSDHLDLDSDNDGIYDVVEAGGTDADNDGDADGAPGNTVGTTGIPATAGTGLTPIETTAGTPDHLNLDSDNDGCTDANEAYSNPNADGGDGGQYGAIDPSTVDGDGLVTEAGIDYTLGTNTAVTFSNNASTCINANSDSNSLVVVGTTGGIAIANILVNDTFGAATATIGTVDITVISSSDPNVTLNTTNGEVNVAPGTAAGTYTIGYQICEAGSAMPCSTSLITIIVDGDYDLDGVGDTTDLDDDNDGILDTVECPAPTGTSVEGPNLVLNSNFDDGYAFWTSDFNRGRGNEDGGTGYPSTSGNTCLDQGWVAISPYNSTDGRCNTYYSYPNTLPGIPDGSVLIVDADQTGANVYYTGGPIPPGAGGDVACDANYISFTDGTLGTLANPNNTLYIDPNDIAGESYWKQTVPNIEANSTYVFRCFIYIVEQNPELAFIINGTTVFNSPVGDGSVGQEGTWQEVEFNWDSVAVSGAVTIEIANTQGGCFGNDIRLDDITLAKLFADFDGDGISNCRDIDSDNDGIPDTVEAQPTSGYVSLPNNGVVGTSVDPANGIPNVFPTAGFTPENTDLGGEPDYLDLDSDDEGDNDTVEAGFTPATNTLDDDGDGLLNQYDASPTDAAGAIDYDDDQNGGSLDLPNNQNPETTEVDYRDPTDATDTDNDGVFDIVDFDDDNDGILDTVECFLASTALGSTTTPYANSLETFLLPTGTILNAGQSINSAVTLPDGTTITATITNNPGSVSINSIETNDVRPAGLFLGLTGNGTPPNTDDGFRGVAGSQGGSYTLVYAFDTPTDVFFFDAETSVMEPSQAITDGDPFEILDIRNDAFFNFNGLDPRLVSTQTLNINTTNATVADAPVAIFLSRNTTQLTFNINQEPGGLTGIGVGAFKFVCLDTDGDEVPDNLDLDSDNDGIYDVVEAGGTDNDNNGYADDLDGDSTNDNGIPDSANGGAGISNPTDTNSDGSFDYVTLDSDSDGCSDANEAYNSPTIDGGDTGVFGTDPADPTTIVDPVTGLVNAATYPDPVNTDSTGGLDYQQIGGPDSDGDGIPDACDLTFDDNDGDGIGDAVDLDDDNDGILDCDEQETDSGDVTTLTTSAASGSITTEILGDTYASVNFDFVTVANDILLPESSTSGGIDYFSNENILGNPANSGTYYLPAFDASDAIAIENRGNYTLTYSQTVVNPSISLFSIGNQSGPTRIEYTFTDGSGNPIPFNIIASSEDDIIFGSSSTVFTKGATDNILIGQEGSGTIQFLGEITEININTTILTGQTFEFYTALLPVSCVPRDTDSDGIFDYLDLDSDNDGIYDVVEAGGTDNNNDGIADGVVGTTLATNGIPDSAGTGTIPTDSGPTPGTPDYVDLDSDEDGCSDANEAYADANADGGDGGIYNPGNTAIEPLSLADNTINADGSVVAAAYTDPVDGDSVGGLDYQQIGGPDADGDSIPDTCDPVFNDVDGDGVSDIVDLDNDNDGILDTSENCGVITNFSNPDGDLIGEGTVAGQVVTMTYSSNQPPPPAGPTFGQIALTSDGRAIYGENTAGNVYTHTIVFSQPVYNLKVVPLGVGNIPGRVPSYVGNFNITLEDGTVLNSVSLTVTPGTLAFPASGPETVVLDNNVPVPGTSGVDYITDLQTPTGNGDQANGTIDLSGFTSSLGVTQFTWDVFGDGGGTALLGVQATICLDTDGDNIPDFLDVDADNDGIYDILETGNGALDTDNDGVVDGNSVGMDGIPDAVQGNVDGDPVTTVISNTDMNPNDGPDFLDIDADDDGIPDNVEAQPTDNYVVALGVDADMDGIDDAYDPICNLVDLSNPADGNADECAAFVVGTALLVEDTDSDLTPDYLDTDSDGDGASDVSEAGQVLMSGLTTDIDGDGLLDIFDNSDDTGGLTDINDNLDAGAISTDNIDDADLTEVDFRSILDADNDGIADNVDLDDDNDGIADALECPMEDTAFLDFTGQPNVANGVNLYNVSTLNNEMVFRVEYVAANSVLNYRAQNFTSNNGNVVDSQSTLVLDEINMGGILNREINFIREYLDQDILYLVNLDTSDSAVIIITAFDESNNPIDLSGTSVIGVGGDGATIPNWNGSTGTLTTSGSSDNFNSNPVYINLSGLNIYRINYRVNTVFSDGAGVSLGTRIACDTDGDGIPNHLDLDSDNDGLYDVVETGNGDLDTDNDGQINGSVGGNGIPDVAEDGGVDGAGVSGTPIDTDNNPNDGPNFLDIDADDDGIQDNIEGQPTVGYIAPIADNPATPLVDESDTDGNGVNDAYDSNGTAIDPSVADIDGTGGGDYIDTDADGDGIPDATEAYDTDGDNIPDTLPAGADADSDGLDDNYDTIDLGTTPATNATDGGELATDFPDDDNVGGDRDWRDPLDADDDGIADNIDEDDDNDGIPDVVESGGNAPNGDEDGDGVPNWQDTTDDDPGNTIGDSSTTVYTDSNGDGVPDVYDFDGDGIPNHLDLDSDNDGLYDVVETGNGSLDTDNDGQINGSVGANGIPDVAEDGGVDGAGVSGTPTDTDNNPNDGPNYLDIDADDDGITDNVEGQPTVGYIAPIVDNPATPLVDESDTDGNGVNDAYDTNGSALDPDAIDTDGTGGGDYIDTDADGDGIPDATEAYDTDGDNVPDTLPSGNDSDGDGLDDNYDSDGTSTTDAGGATDGGELATDFPDDDNVGGDRDWRDPLDADGDSIADNIDEDDDNDGITDVVESGGNAPNGDEDGDGVPNWQDTTDDDPGNTIGDSSTTVYTDSNGDGVPDVYDFDGDGIPNHLDLDSDNDGLYDVVETGNGSLDTDNDGQINGSVGANGIPDVAEDGGVDGAGVSGTPTDTDGNINDGPNYLDIDADDDGITDNVEGQPTVGYIAPIVDNPATPLVDESDTDGNGVNDAYDTNGSALDPDSVDVDGTGGGDYIDTDADDDGIPDATEAYDTDGDNIPDTLPAGADADGDGLDDNYDTIDLGTTPATNATDGGELATDFPDDDNAGGDRDWRDPLDADGDGIADNIDEDDDNDGITDVVESGGNAPNGDEDGDGVPNWQDDTDNDPGNTIGDSSTTVYTDSNGDGVPDVYDFDGDGIPNHLDLDSDNDGLYDVVETGNGNLDTDNDGQINGSVGSNGIPDVAEDGGVDGAGVSGTPTDTDGNINDGPNYLDIDADDDGITDNVEGQPTVGYIAPLVDNPATPLVDESDTDGNGVNDAYDTNGSALDPDAIDTDGTGGGDYIDTDADGDGVFDVIEGNQGTLLGVDTDGDGLDDGFEGGTINDTDVNDELDNGSLDTPDADGDALTGGDVDYRDADDLDNDGIPDSVDLDDDNDGILDTAEDPNLDGDNNPYTEGTPGENDSDNDGIPDFQDIDSDNDGIPDNVEGQSTAGYTQPFEDDPLTPLINEADTDNDGLNDAYEGTGDQGIIPENTDGVDTPDYIDLDSDQDGVSDTIEAGFDLANDTTDTDNDGLLDDYEGSDPNDGFDPNDELNNGSNDTQNTDTIDEVDYRDLDDDNDGVDTAEEDYDGDNDPTNQDSDGDMIPDYLDIDDDGDGVNTSEENPNPDGDGDPNTGTTQDTDNDTIPDYLDIDDDGDNIPTIDENPNADGDGNPDTNGDGIPDAQDTDGNGVPDYLDEDDDGDSVNTIEEDYDGDNDPTNQDTDGDSTPDYLDIDDDNDGIDTINEDPDPNTDGDPADAVDTDGDTIPDYLDNDDLDNDGIPDSIDLDDDNDGILDTAEDPNLDGDNNPYTEGTPGENDSDGDGIPNFQDIDSDNDGIPDNVEGQSTTGYIPPSGTDLDMDGLDDAYEGTGDQGITVINTDGVDTPDYIDFDSDNDGVLDTIEAGFIEANDIGDADGDGLLDDYEGSDINDGFDTNDDLNNGSDDTQNTDTIDEVDYRDIDDDNDGVDTIHEDVNINSNPVDDDTDGDGTPNYLDIDDDGDGVSTVEENPNSDGDGDPMTGVTQDTDGDDIPDYLDIDDDGDNVPTFDENPDPDGDIDPNTGNTQDTDGDSIPDYLDVDDDGDTVNTIEEDYDGNNDPTDTDTDGDGIPDYLDDDDDDDNILTEDESPDPNGDGNPDDAIDTDGNGTPDYLEPNNVDPDAEDGVIVYTGITPNGDGSNDIFVIQGIENLENTLEIYNRWGVKVYGSKNYGRNNNFFKGISTGRTTIEEKDQLPAGTYYYVLEYVLQSGESKNRAGYLYINR